MYLDFIVLAWIYRLVFDMWLSALRRRLSSPRKLPKLLGAQVDDVLKFLDSIHELDDLCGKHVSKKYVCIRFAR